MRRGNGGTGEQRGEGLSVKITRQELSPGVKSELDSIHVHTNNATLHVTQINKNAWNAKAEVSQIPTVVSQLINDANYTTALGHNHDERYYTESEINDLLSGKAKSSVVNGHINSSTVHVTQEDKDKWDAGGGRVEVFVSIPTSPTAGQLIFLEVV